jgi:pimeloyl-ACP methyl ester carboxylesterase
MEETYAEASNKRVSTANGLDYAYREVGTGSTPLVLLQHFRGNLDNWDPALVDSLAVERRVIAFDNAGVGGSSGTTPNNFEQMAHDAIAYTTAMGLEQIDILGYSIGSFVAQEMALIQPDLVRKVVLASSAPKGATGMHGWAPEVIGAVGKRGTDPVGYLRVFYTQTPTSSDSGRKSQARMFARQTDRDTPTTWETRLAQYDAVCAWGIPDHSLLQRLEAITMPVFVANGDSDRMVLPRYSHLLAGLLPNATLKVYPDAAHGFLFQRHAEFAADVHGFLGD